MKKEYPNYFLIGLMTVAFWLTHSSETAAQCQEGEVTISIAAHSYDVWAEECYWEVVPAANGCGNGTITSGGSAEIGCDGNGPSGENGIPDFSSEFATICLPEGEFFDLIFVDSYGDGGMAFDIYQDGYFILSYYGGGFGNTWTFQAGTDPAVAHDSACGAALISIDAETTFLNTSECAAAFREPAPLGLSCMGYGMWCEPNASRTGWAYFIAQEGVSYEISTCNTGTTFDTQLAVWASNDCGLPWEFSLLTANDDAWQGCGEGHPWSSTCYVSCLPEGTIVYVMVDGFDGQTGDAEISVSTFGGETYMEVQVNDVVCPLEGGAAPNGSIFPSIFGTGSDFQCEWTGPNGYSTNSHFVFDLGPGTYNLTATTNCGEVFTGEYQIGLPEPWDVFISSTSASCPASTDGTITVEASGASPEYDYYYDGPGDFWGSGQTLSNAISGNYFVVVEDSRGCRFEQSITVPSSDDLTFDLGSDLSVCLGDTIAIEGPPGLNYLWHDGSEESIYTGYTIDWGEGTFAVILSAHTDDGCSHTDALVVEVEVCIGLNELESTSTLLYPNPGNDELWIRSEENYRVEEWNIIDATGRIVLQGNALSSPMRISTQMLSPALYFVRLFPSGKTYPWVKQ